MPSDVKKDGGRFAELRRDPMAFAGAILLTGFILIAIFGPLIAPFDPAHQSLVNRLQPPVFGSGGSWHHVMGTDGLGRDVLSRAIYGTRSTMIIGVAVVTVSLILGGIVGLVAGYAGGWVDAFLMRTVDVQVAFPGLLLAVTIVAMVGASTTTVIAVLTLLSWVMMARIIRGAVQVIMNKPFIEAAQVVGCTAWRIVVHHIIPHLIPVILTLIVTEFAVVVLAEASLSFLGLGVQPPTISLGLDVANGRQYLLNAGWIVAFPGSAIALLVIATNLFAAWLRTTLDPVERDSVARLSSVEGGAA